MTWDIKSAPKLDFDEDYYKVLEVDSKIDYKDLKKAYYSIVFIYHPGVLFLSHFYHAILLKLVMMSY